jgi:hypothetical protein
MDTVEEALIGLCPSCGKPLKIERTGGTEKGEISVHCEEFCSNSAAIPSGARIMKDDIGLIFTDGDMHEYTREDYIKNHGIDPLPIWRAIEKERGLTTEARR